MQSIKFSSIEELYNRLKPALLCKKEELKKQGFSYIKAEDIWNALRKLKWQNSTNLSLHEMVSDILNTNSSFFDEYIKNEYSKIKRRVDLDEEDIL